MSSILEREQKVIREFQPLQQWEDRYKKLIALGKALPELPENMKTSEALVKGCQSQVWLHARLSPEGRVIFEGDSDALLVKGLVALVLQIYSNATPAEILQTPPLWIKEIGFEQNLTPSRANGLHAMLKQIRNFATAFAVLLQQRP